MSALVMADSGPWSLGTLIWLPVCALLIAALLVGWRLLAWKAVDEKDNAYGWSTEARFASIACIIVAVLLVVGTAWGMYPYKAEYHQWRTINGTVAKIDNRLIGTGDGMETKFVVRFNGGSGQYGCDDTRCAQVREGDRLSLSCKRAWQYTGTDGYDCRFISTKAAS